MSFLQDYTITILCVHFIFAIILFFIINWIGKHSISIGYIQMSLLVKEDEAPAFNFLIRVLSPVVYLIIVSAFLYKFGLDIYVKNIYMVSVLYLGVRFFVNILTNRCLLMNWVRQFWYWSFIISLSIITYEYLIKTKQNIIPDFTTIANELWIIIFLFIYQLFNNIRLSNDKTKKRKERYISSRYTKFKRKYNEEIHRYFNNDIYEALTYSIMIYEDFNRPLFVRVFEYISFIITRKPHSLGIMQFTTNEYINNSKSILLAMNKIKSDCNDIIAAHEPDFYQGYEYSLIYNIAEKYNGGEEYAKEVRSIYDYLIETAYRGTTDSLLT